MRMAVSILRFQDQFELGCPRAAWTLANPIGYAAWLHWRREVGLDEWPDGLAREPLEVAP